MAYVPIDYKNQPLKLDKLQWHVVYSLTEKRLPLHNHDFIEIAFILSGCGKEVINGIEHELKSGSFSVLLPWHMHEVIPDAHNPLEMIICSFRLELFINKNNFFELDDLLFDIMDTPTNATFENADFKLVMNIFNQLLREFSEQKKWKNIIFKSKITEILVLFRRCKNDTFPNNNSEIEKKEVIWEIIDFIHINRSTKNFTLSYTAEKFDQDVKNFNLLIKQNTGLKFNELLNDVRIRTACTILLLYSLTFPLNSDSSLSQAYIYPGYKNRQSFIKAFKKFKGLSPEEFVKTYSSNFMKESSLTVVPKLYLQVVYYLHLHYDQELTLADISKQFQSNENYISSLLKSQTGQSFNDLLDEIRIFHACDLLKYTKKDLNEISFEIGFTSVEDFFNKFKNLKGEWPDSYRSSSCKFHKKKILSHTALNLRNIRSSREM